MRWYILIFCSLWLAMCGQKGPLYLPEPESHLPPVPDSPVASRAAPAAAA